ncbi:MAG TPA: OmpA family protein [Kofleriaceae bacterium]
MIRLLRPTIVAALAAGGLAASTRVADANVEIGGSSGIHVFAHDNELGVADIPNANSERNSAMFGVRLGVFFTPMFGVEGEFGLIPSEARKTVFDVWNITYRAQFVAQFRTQDPQVKLIPFVLVGAGAMQIVDNSGSEHDPQIAKDTDGMLYVGGGIKYRVDSGWGLRADVRLLFPPSSKDNGFTEDFEALLTIYKEFGRTAAPKPPPVDDDPDHDGIRGAADKCPNDPEDKDGFQDEDGCPDLDNDGDGIPDAKDKCPNEPEDKDGFQDEDGCPDPDNDGDGIPDAQDKCPNEPETKNGYQDEDGCPDEIPQKLKQFTGVIQGINFKVGDSALQPSSFTTLDKAVAVLKEFGELKLEIQGHTDDQPVKAGGKFADNTALSQARAESVKAYFVSKGIDEKRLTAKGYGETVPVESPQGLTGGKLNAARAKNRRVEFKLVSSLTQ